MCVNSHLLNVCILNKWVSGANLHCERAATFGTSYKELSKDAKPSCQPSTLLPCPMLEVPEQESPEPWMQPCGSLLEPRVIWEC